MVSRELVTLAEWLDARLGDEKPRCHKGGHSHAATGRDGRTHAQSRQLVCDLLHGLGCGCKESLGERLERVRHANAPERETEWKSHTGATRLGHSFAGRPSRGHLEERT